jgi:hypothetical protein
MHTVDARRAQLERPDADLGLARVAEDLNRRWSDLPVPITMPFSEEPVVIMDRDAPWLVAPAERDPLRDHDGRIALPRRPRGRLMAIAQRGIPFQRIVIAHELDPHSRPVEELRPALRLGPITHTDEQARRLVGPAPPHPGVRRAVDILDRLVDGASGAAGRTLDAVLDPIVFGVIAATTPSHGEPALFYPLDAWRW